MNFILKKWKFFLVSIVVLFGVYFWGCNHDKFETVVIPENEAEIKSSFFQELSWDYPVKPGTEEWSLFKTEEERINALQVPEVILSTFSTEDIVRLSVTFPHFGYFTAFNTPQQGFSVMFERFNIFGNLLACKDAGKGLIATYKDAGLSGFKTLPYSNECWPIKLYFFELLLSQREILQSLSSESKLELMMEAMAKFYEKINHESFSSLPGVCFTLRIMASILDVEEYQEFSASLSKVSATKFLQSGWLFDEAVPIEEIIRISESYINVKNQIQ